MGEVYLARDVEIGRDVALKVLPSTFSSDKDRLQRFQQEACAFAHRNCLKEFILTCSLRGAARDRSHNPTPR